MNLLKVSDHLKKTVSELMAMTDTEFYLQLVYIDYKNGKDNS